MNLALRARLTRNNVRDWRIRRYLRRRGVRVYTRRQWGTEHADLYRLRRIERPVTADPADTLVQHITVTVPSDGGIREDARRVEEIGVERFGSGVSYNFLVDMDNGDIAVGQPLDAKGTHTINEKDILNFSYDQNLVARAVAVVGMPETPLSSKAERSLVLLMRALVKFGALTKGFDYAPHSLFAFKDCPCDNTRKVMGFLRSLV